MLKRVKLKAATARIDESDTGTGNQSGISENRIPKIYINFIFTFNRLNLYF